MNARSTALVYGLLLAGGFMILVLGFGRVVGGAAFALVLGAYLLLTGWLPWRRLGLRLSTTGIYLAGLALIALGWLALSRSQDLVRLPAAQLVPLLALLLSGPVLLWIDRLRHREAWERWREALDRASLGDLILGRHYPR